MILSSCDRLIISHDSTLPDNKRDNFLAVDLDRSAN